MLLLGPTLSSVCDMFGYKEINRGSRKGEEKMTKIYLKINTFHKLSPLRLYPFLSRPKYIIRM